MTGVVLAAVGLCGGPYLCGALPFWAGAEADLTKMTVLQGFARPYRRLDWPQWIATALINPLCTSHCRRLFHTNPSRLLFNIDLISLMRSGVVGWSFKLIRRRLRCSQPVRGSHCRGSVDGHWCGSERRPLSCDNFAARRYWPPTLRVRLGISWAHSVSTPWSRIHSHQTKHEIQQCRSSDICGRETVRTTQFEKHSWITSECRVATMTLMRDHRITTRRGVCSRWPDAAFHVNGRHDVDSWQVLHVMLHRRMPSSLRKHIGAQRKWIWSSTWVGVISFLQVCGFLYRIVSCQESLLTGWPTVGIYVNMQWRGAF